jgi:hypothetical protein
MEIDDIQLLMGIMEHHDVEEVRHVTTFAGVRKGKALTIEVMDSLVERSRTRYLVAVTAGSTHVLVGPARATAQDALTAFPWVRLD